MVKKYTNKYYFSVEGETEKWYLEWLRDRINELDESRYKVSIDCKVEKDPYRRAKKNDYCKQNRNLAFIRLRK